MPNLIDNGAQARMQDIPAPGNGGRRAVIAAQGDRVESFLRKRLANPADAQDLAQEAYLRLLRVKQPQLIQDPVAYLFRIARNLVSEQYSKAPPAADSLDQIEICDAGITTEEAAEVEQQIDRLNDVLQHLPPKCRAAMLMHRRYGMTVDEIAAELSLSRGMIKKYLAMGLARCRARLRRFHEET